MSETQCLKTKQLVKIAAKLDHKNLNTSET